MFWLWKHFFPDLEGFSFNPINARQRSRFIVRLRISRRYFTTAESSSQRNAKKKKIKIKCQKDDIGACGLKSISPYERWDYALPSCLDGHHCRGQPPAKRSSSSQNSWFSDRDFFLLEMGTFCSKIHFKNLFCPGRLCNMKWTPHAS